MDIRKTYKLQLTDNEFIFTIWYEKVAGATYKFPLKQLAVEKYKREIDKLSRTTTDNRYTNLLKGRVVSFEPLEVINGYKSGSEFMRFILDCINRI